MNSPFLEAFEIMKNDRNKVARTNNWCENQYIYLNEDGILYYCSGIDSDKPFQLNVYILENATWKTDLHPSKKLVTFCEMIDKVLNEGKSATMPNWSNYCKVFRSLGSELLYRSPSDHTGDFFDMREYVVNKEDINSKWIILD